MYEKWSIFPHSLSFFLKKKKYRFQEPKLWYGIGILYDRYGSLDHAEEAFSAVMNMEPKFEKANEIYFRLGIIYKQQQKFDLSLQVWLKNRFSAGSDLLQVTALIVCVLITKFYYSVLPLHFALSSTPFDGGGYLVPDWSCVWTAEGSKFFSVIPLFNHHRFETPLNLMAFIHPYLVPSGQRSLRTRPQREPRSRQGPSAAWLAIPSAGSSLCQPRSGHLLPNSLIKIGFHRCTVLVPSRQMLYGAAEL